MTITRQIISNNVKIYDLTTHHHKNKIFTIDNITNGINFYSIKLQNLNLNQNTKIIIYKHLSLDYICLLFAILENRFDIIISDIDIDPGIIDDNTFILTSNDYLNHFKKNNFNEKQIIFIENPDYNITYKKPINISNRNNKIISYTSGSSGKPKKIVHSVDSMLYSASLMVPFLNETKKIITHSTLNHLGAMSVLFLPALMAGLEIYCTFHWVGDIKYFELSKKYNIDTMLIFPIFWWELRNKIKSLNLSNIKTIITGGDRISNELINDFKSLGVNRILSIYGATEALPPVSIISQEDLNNVENENGYLLLGEPLDDINVIINDNNNIMIKGKNVCQSINDKIISDYVEIDDEGMIKNNILYIKGRNDFIINKEQKKVYTFTIRNFLNTELCNYFPNEEIKHSFNIGLCKKTQKLFLLCLSEQEKNANSVINLLDEKFDVDIEKTFIFDKFLKTGLKINFNAMRKLYEPFINGNGKIIRIKNQ